MKKNILTTLVVLGSLLAAPSYAGFVKGDWNNQGDNLAALDTDTGLEWLSFTATSGMSFSQVSDLLSTDFLGWRLPTRLEVNTVMEHATLISIDFANNGNDYGYAGYDDSFKASSIYFASVFGNSHSVYSGGVTTNYSYGVYGNDDFNQGGNSVLSSGSAYISENNYGSAIDDVDAGDFMHPAYSVFLVSDSSEIDPEAPTEPEVPVNVPLPATGLLLSLALAGFGMRKKYK
jgi:hypothetical protein